MKSGSIILRFLWMPVSIAALLSITSLLVRGVNGLAHYLAPDGYEFGPGYLRGVEFVALTILACVSSVYLIAEIVDIFASSQRLSGLLFHFRFGPVVVLFLSSLITLGCDAAMIEISKYRIRQYVFDSGESTEPPQIKLFNNYRHWCGNGFSAQENYLYFDTASSGIDNEDPHVRARSLLMAADVRDFLNGGDPRFREYLRAACDDDDPIVYQTAETYLRDSNTSCSELESKQANKSFNIY